MNDPACAEWHAPAHWRAIDFISDLHLQASDHRTLAGWQHHLQQPLAQRADALCILGDLFEVWVGDDVLQPNAPADTAEASTEQTQQTEHAHSHKTHQTTEHHEEDRPFWRRCAATLRAYSQHTPVFFMPGNRDFLLGEQALRQCGMQALADPTALVFLGSRWLLSHGDALCWDDTAYMQFRAQVRQPAWQRDFLARPLAAREAMARQLRQQSQAHKAQHANNPAQWADVDTQAARAELLRSGCHTLIHGHTHRPMRHDLGDGLQRVVLSDWDLCAQPPRAEVLRLDANGLHRRPLSV